MHPLDGIKVLDLTRVVAGPVCTSMLGNMGADVIRIENPDEPDSYRYDDKVFGEGKDSSMFLGNNMSKKGITLNLKQEKGLEIFYDLVKNADIVVENFRPKVTERLKVDYQTLKKINPRLIYCTITAFGETGPLINKPGMDIIAQAMGGTMSVTGEPDRPPVRIGPSIADFVAAYLAYGGIMTALYVREKLGEGQKISISLLDGQVALLSTMATGYFASGKVPVRAGSGHFQIEPYRLFSTRDDDIIIACLDERFWRRLCNVLGKPEWVEDNRFKHNTDRVKNRSLLVPMINDILGTKLSGEWLKLLEENDIPCCRVNTIDKVFEEEQVIHNDMVKEIDHPLIGKIKVLRTPINLSLTPGKTPVAGPYFGQHTDEFFKEIGYSEEGIKRLKETGVI